MNLYPIRDWSEFMPKEFEYNGKWIDNGILSNMCISPFIIDGIEYGSVENYYQSHKVNDPLIWESMSKISPRQAKSEGRKLRFIREDWEMAKVGIMLKGLMAKFDHDPFKSLLLETGNTKLIEWNNWGDRIWGADVKDGKGRNILGILQMDVRSILTH